ncbi:MAG: DHH family phosphoesterase [Lachnospiraceae bacterium]|nr:DHH family phosphoesterase [Lachnospiraceae bacterium]
MEKIMDWIKSGDETTLEEYFERRLGPLEDIDRDYDFNVPGIADFIEYIKTHGSDEYIVIGDYDTDGITATAVMKIGLEQYFRLKGVNKIISYRLPKRFSEGYGISAPVIEDIPGGSTVITVDNGIAAIDEIKVLKQRGNKVLLTDHHLPVVIDKKNVLPPADILIDPHVDDEGFEDYCGAGLAYKIMKRLLPEDDPVLPLLNAYAAIGTVSDVVPLIKENRAIVKSGLEVLNGRRGILTRGLKALIAGLKLGEKEIESDDIAFYIAPALTAVSRLFDSGAQNALLTIIDNSRETAAKRAEALISENERRKRAVEKAMKEADGILKGKELRFPVMLKLSAGEGIIGLVASKLCDRYRAPAIVFTENEYASNELKGSARSTKDCHIKELFDRHRELFMQYGGHAGAAGCTVKNEDFEKLKAELKEDLKDYKPSGRVYDLELSPENAMGTIDELKKYKPFGEGNREPVFHIKEKALYCSLMGKDEEHIKFGFNGVDVVAFRQSESIEPVKRKPGVTVDAFGRLSVNVFKDISRAQMIADDIYAK